jgi:hypothetical protein
MKTWMMDTIPGLVGAAIGGVIGYYIYLWGLRQGLVAGVFPGAFVGLGGGLASARPSTTRGVILGVAALGLGLFAEWKNFPFVADESLPYFLAHVHQLKPLTLIMIALGAFLGYRWGSDAFRPGLPGKPKPSTSRPE